MPDELPEVKILTERRVRRITASHLYRYIRAARGDYLPKHRKPKNPKVITYINEVLAAHAFAIYPPLRSTDNWDLLYYIFPIPAPPFPKGVSMRPFPEDAIVIDKRTKSPSFVRLHDFASLRDHGDANALIALNAVLAQVAAVLDGAVPSGLLVDACHWREHIDEAPRSTATELQQALAALRWCLAASRQAHDGTTVELWHHIIGSACFYARLSAMMAIDALGETPPLLVIDEAIDWLAQEQLVPPALQGFGQSHATAPMRDTVRQRATDWERACEELAQLLFPEVVFQATLQNLSRPDIVVVDAKLKRDPQGRIVHCSHIIDAKTGDTAGIDQYKPFADKVEAWHLRDGAALAEKARKAGDEQLAQRILLLSRRHGGPELLYLENLRARRLRNSD